MAQQIPVTSEPEEVDIWNRKTIGNGNAAYNTSCL